MKNKKMIGNIKLYIFTAVVIFTLMIMLALCENKQEIKEYNNILFKMDRCKNHNQFLNTPKYIPPAYTTEYKAVESGQSVYLILKSIGLSESEIYYATTQISKVNKNYLNLRAGQMYKLNKKDGVVVSIDFLKNKGNFLRIDFSDGGVAVYEDNVDYDIKYEVASGEIVNSFYVDGLMAGLTDRQIQEFSYIFAWDIDFSRDIRGGDEFKVVYEDLYDGDRFIKKGRIIGAYVKNNRGEFYAIGHQDNDGQLNYYNLNGDSVEKAFLKAPVKVERVTSRFTKSRYHPILKVNRSHRGVDYGGGLNTPIMSTADGVIIKQRKERAYGNVIMIDHGQGYKTLYAHMNKFNGNFKVGSKVKQGDTIGYMGTTGLSTGVHLHYELRLNGDYKDPLKVDLPRGEKVQNKKSFERQKEEIITYWEQEK